MKRETFRLLPILVTKFLSFNKSTESWQILWDSMLNSRGAIISWMFSIEYPTCQKLGLQTFHTKLPFRYKLAFDLVHKTTLSHEQKYLAFHCSVLVVSHGL